MLPHLQVFFHIASSILGISLVILLLFIANKSKDLVVLSFSITFLVFSLWMGVSVIQEYINVNLPDIYQSIFDIFVWINMSLRVLSLILVIHFVCQLVLFKASRQSFLLMAGLLLTAAVYRMLFNRTTLDSNGKVIFHSVDLLSYVILVEFCFIVFILFKFQKNVQNQNHQKLAKIFSVIIVLSVFSSVLHVFDIRPFSIATVSFLYVCLLALITYYIKDCFIKNGQLNLSEIKIQAEHLPKHYGITKREMEIINLVIQGDSNNEIAEKLFISPGTVKTHLYRIFKKTNSKNRYELMHLCKSPRQPS